MRDVVIVGATRTAIGAFQGSLAAMAASDLGAAVIRRLLEQSGVEAGQVDEVILGQILTAGAGQNPARQAAVKAGLPYEVPAMTLNKLCGSGLKAVQLGAQAIACGDAQIVIAGGQESMSQAPHVLRGARAGLRIGDGLLQDTLLCDGLTDAFHDYHMGITAENLAEKYAIDRAEQDAFALRSQQRASAAQAEGRFRAEIAPLSIPQRKGEPLVFEHDEQPRAGTTLDSLAALRPAFRKDGSVTAGNASTLNDGAAAVLLMSEAAVRRYDVKPIARFASFAVAGVPPEVMGIGPVEAIPRALTRAGVAMADLGWTELNEAFAAQALAVMRQLEMDPAKVNPLGGAIALGHPLGATGAIRTATLMAAMQRDPGLRYGMISMCIGTGMGAAGVFERV